MAKTDSKVAANAKAEVTAENVVEQIKAGNRFENPDITTEATEQLQKEKKDKQVRELKDKLQQADFDEKKALLALRKNRDLEKPVKERLKALDGIIEELKSGKITPTEYNKKYDEIKDNHRKKVLEINKEYEEYNRELRSAYPSYWRWDWED